MKRLNPKTGQPFKHGDARDDGYIFTGYSKHYKTGDYFVEFWKEPIKYQLTQALNKSRSRAKERNLPFDIDLQHLQSIMTSLCPVFKIPLSWGLYGNGSKNTFNSPSLDRVVPEFGYTKGNVVFISGIANMIKQDVTEDELYAVADWLHDKRKEVLNAFKNKPTPLPIGHYSKSEEHTKHWLVPPTGFGEDDNDAHHHCGADAGKDSDHRAQEGSGDSVAHRNKKVEPSRAFESRQDNGDSVPEDGGPQFRGGRVFD